jgi:hemerythrin superfamily protein
MNALEFLKRDHDAIAALLAEAGTYQDKKRSFERIRSALEIHSSLEETLFYPILQSEEPLKVLADDAKAQHRLMRQLLDDMADQDGAEFEKNFQTLTAEAQLHFTGEENEIFPQVARLKSEPDLGRLGERMAMEKKTGSSSQRASA